jgi:DNA-binding response OmpR family regulator
MKKKILLAEDKSSIVIGVKMCLESAGYQVITVKDGLEVLNHAFREKYDLILLDIILPKMDGYKVCEVLKSNVETKSIPIIMMTAKGQRADIERARGVGIKDYIIKPFAPAELLEKVSKVFGE